MSVYSAQEYYDMIRLYFTNGEQAIHAAVEYANLYPNRRHPNKNVIARAIRRLRENGSVLPNYGDVGRPRQVRTPAMEDAILAAINDNPTSSTRSVAHQLGTSHMSIHRVLKEDQQHPYHYTKVQNLLPRDYQPRVNFAEYYLNQVNLRPNYGSRILYTDECLFTRNGMYNIHNYHYWSHENPFLIRESSFQHRYSVNVWCGLLGDQIIGPFILPHRLNSQEYLNFLRNDLPNLLVPAENNLDDVALNRRATIFMHDGAPAHSARIVRRYLDETFPQWFGKGSVTPWPARSPDYNPCDFFLWGALKEKIFIHPNIETADEMTELVFRTIEEINNVQIQRATQNVQNRARACIEVGGAHFEHLL